MNKKVIKDYIYHGLGFPIELHNVVMIMIDGDYHPKIDVRKIAFLTMKTLISQEERFTGNQIKFIRTYFSMSLREFAVVVNESHMAVKKWEDCGDKPTHMDRNIEIMLRLHIYNEIIIKATRANNVKSKAKFYNQFVALTKMFSYQNAKC